MMTVVSRWSPLDGLYRWEKERPDAVFLTQPVGDQVWELTWADAAGEVRRAAAYLKSLGLERGSRIAILGKNSAHWFLADLAIWMAGHVSVPIYPSLNAETIRYILDHSEASLLFVGALDDWPSMRPGVPADLPMISLPGGPTIGNGFPWWGGIVGDTAPLRDSPRRQPEELATLVYTSGTTGQPKGVMLSFESFDVSSTILSQITELGADDRMLSYLPLAHVFEGAAVFASSLRVGFQVFFNESLQTFGADLRRARPTIFLSVPRLWSKFQQGVLAKIPQEKLDALLGDPATADATRRQVLTSLGLQDTRVAVSGSAPLPPSLIDWYRRLGLELLEGLGMSEDFAYSHVSRIGRARSGYVGESLPGVERRIADSGELLIRSPARMMGYYKAPELTAAAFTMDGFFKTGDLADIDELGRIRLTGRLKELFKTAKGKYVAPAPIECKFVHPAVEAICVVGANLGQPFALLMLGADARNASATEAAQVALGAELEQAM
ncbi:MAG: AMP-binding protein, partial [Nevskia sp.]|nr:AMP-binding protein [Nevskia sp.]